MQGVVFGTRTEMYTEDERLLTRLDFDQAFGTVINRFCCQAVIGHPLTLFGKGLQKRGFIPLQDSMQCLTLALDNPPEEGEYRVFNQFAQVYDLTELAKKVQKVAGQLGMDVEIRQVENPRQEAEEHRYNPDHQHLFDLGYRPQQDIESEIELMLQHLQRYRERIESRKEVLLPDIRWTGQRQRVKYING